MTEGEKRSNYHGSEWQPDETNLTRKEFRKWKWTDENGRFVITVRFKTEQREDEKFQIVAAALEEAEKHIRDILRKGSDGIQA
jgi:hypothetical protein